MHSLQVKRIRITSLVVKQGQHDDSVKLSSSFPTCLPQRSTAYIYESDDILVLANYNDAGWGFASVLLNVRRTCFMPHTVFGQQTSHTHNRDCVYVDSSASTLYVRFQYNVQCIRRRWRPLSCRLHLLKRVSNLVFGGNAHSFNHHERELYYYYYFIIILKSGTFFSRPSAKGCDKLQCRNKKKRFFRAKTICFLLREKK